MARVWDKIDTGLAMIYAYFLHVRDEGANSVAPVEPPVAEGDKLHVSLRFTGDLATVEGAGFETTWTDGESRATGALRLDDLQNIAELDEVITIKYGRKFKLNLADSVPQINADELWTLNQTTGEFSSKAGGATGAGVLIGVIDTGIDINHPFFWKEVKTQTATKKETRIRRIWDMGLIPKGGEKSPEKRLLDPGTPGTYGVEYTQDHINADLNPSKGVPKVVRHKDCAAHGTHVASIAAGDGHPGDKLGIFYVGVAPRAELIVVKMLLLDNEPKVGSTSVSPEQMFMDAVTYVRKVADELGPGGTAMPVVINFSAGSDDGPHDGLTELETWLDNEFKSSAGKVFVNAAGNAAGVRGHAVLEFTATRHEIIVPFVVTDTRKKFEQLEYCPQKGKRRPDPSILYVEFYYSRAGTTVAFEIKPPGAPDFIQGPALGPSFSNLLGFVIREFSGKYFGLSHMIDPDTLPGGQLLVRNHFFATINTPNYKNHKKGTYLVKVTADAPITVHAWCGPVQYDDTGKINLGIELGKDPLPAGARQEDKVLITTPGGARNVITVANYDPTAGQLDVDPSSSRGPLTFYAGVSGPLAPKPDIGAPGAEIYAAASSQATALAGVKVIGMGGTSMAAPHVAGTVALMLEKQKTLTPALAISKLKAHALKTPAPVADDVGEGRLDAEKTVKNTP